MFGVRGTRGQRARGVRAAVAAAPRRRWRRRTEGGAGRPQHAVLARELDVRLTVREQSFVTVSAFDNSHEVARRAALGTARRLGPSSRDRVMARLASTAELGAELPPGNRAIGRNVPMHPPLSECALRETQASQSATVTVMPSGIFRNTGREHRAWSSRPSRVEVPPLPWTARLCRSLHCSERNSCAAEGIGLRPTLRWPGQISESSAGSRQTCVRFTMASPSS